MTDGERVILSLQDLCDYLHEVFPHRLPHNDISEREMWREIGRQDIVQLITELTSSKVVTKEYKESGKLNSESHYDDLLSDNFFPKKK